MNRPTITRRKLIEVALPLEAINIASAREKSIRHGHPSTLHLWWARRPLAAARAVIFAQMVDDPSAWPDLFPTAKKQEQERQRLFRIIEDLVKWENTTNEEVLQKARDEIWRSWRRACAENVGHPQAKELFDRDKLPAFHDSFAGGGALPLEAQRLGLEAYASDLNPVAVLINKAMIEIPPKFAGKPPVNPHVAQTKSEWKGAEGLAEDVRYYGKWMRDEAERRIGHLYPKVKVSAEMVEERPDLQQYQGKELTVIAWIWARTVKSPNPAFRDVEVPLAATFLLSTKAGKEAYIEPLIQGGGYRFRVKVGKPADEAGAKAGTKLERANFACVLSGAPISGDYIKSEGKAGRMGSRLMAMVAEGDRGRVYLSPTLHDEDIATSASPTWAPEGEIAARMTGGNCTPYGLTSWADLFTARQLEGLTTFSDLVQEVRERVKSDSVSAGLADDGKGINDGGFGATAYADAIATYLTFAVDKCSDYWSSICTWHNSGEKMRNTFGRQAIPMTWDYAEGNPFSESTGNWMAMVDWTWKALATVPGAPFGEASQADAGSQQNTQSKVVSTDPPYYDNIGYADLSDFFYVWARRSLRNVYPALFSTMAVPKMEELVATPYRHGGKDAAEVFFVDGMTKAMRRICEQAHEAFPVTIYYAFKQSESTDSGGQASTGWETFLEAVIRSGFALTGTWPMRTELGNRMISSGTNALASSIILVCRKRATSAPEATRREFLLALEKELAAAVADLQRGNVAPVDLQQAAIGPGMAIFTRYSQVLDADGKPLTVREALTLINQALDEVLAHQEGDFDSDTRWALAWFEQFGFAEGDYGIAETLSKAKNTSVEGIRVAGIGTHGRGKVRLFKPEELPADWSPDDDKRLTVWDMVHHLIRTLEQGEEVAAGLLAQLGTRADIARELAYRLYSICERKKRSADALRYNALVQSWPEILQIAQNLPSTSRGGLMQDSLFEGEP
jgi:putative DNA methylase